MSYTLQILDDYSRYEEWLAVAELASISDTTRKLAKEWKTNPDCTLYYLEENETIISTAMFIKTIYDDPDSITLAALGVIESKQGSGIGTQLMSLLCEELKKNTLRFMVWWTTMATGFYEKLGYIQLGHMPRSSGKNKNFYYVDVTKIE